MTGFFLDQQLNLTRKFKHENQQQKYYNTEIQMKEVVYTTAVTFSKKDIVMNGIGEAIHSAMMQMLHNAHGQFADLICSDLRDQDNNYQFILTIRPLEG